MLIFSIQNVYIIFFSNFLNRNSYSIAFFPQLKPIVARALIIWQFPLFFFTLDCHLGAVGCQVLCQLLLPHSYGTARITNLRVQFHIQIRQMAVAMTATATANGDGDGDKDSNISGDSC